MPCDARGWPKHGVDIGVDLWGRPFPDGCRILDAAHRFAAGSHRKGLASGKFGAVCYSFGPQKELSGPLGGAAVFASAQLAGRCRNILNCSHLGRGLAPCAWSHSTKGLMPEPVAAFLTGQLSEWEQRKSHRLYLLRKYYDRFKGTGVKLLTTPNYASGHLCVIRVKPEHERPIRALLRENDIETSKHYRTSYGQGFIGDALAPDNPAGLITLPLHHRLSKFEVEFICDLVLGVAKRYP